MATIEERLAALEALLGLSEGEAPYVSKYSGPEIDEGIELAQSGTVRKTGDKMTGNLTVEKSTPIVNLNDTAVGTGGRVFSANNRIYAQIANLSGSDANRRQLVLANSAAVDKPKALALHDIVDGALTAYYLYGEHNKPTAATLNAAEALHNHKGQSINPSAVELAGASAHGGYIDFHFGGSTGDHTSRIMESAEGVVELNGSPILTKASGAMRIATGSYTGTASHGQSVLLSCGFKPAFAIIYRAADNISPVETDNVWSDSFAILVPTAGGYYINVGLQRVTVESGDTYLKFTPSGTDLNLQIKYNYIIVGS